MWQILATGSEARQRKQVLQLHLKALGDINIKELRYPHFFFRKRACSSFHMFSFITCLPAILVSCLDSRNANVLMHSVVTVVIFRQ